LEELAPLQLMIRQLERELGESTGTPDLPEVTGTAQPGINFSAGRSPDIRPDEFFGMSQSEAAKAYLNKVSKAVSLDELVTALNKGGAKVGGASPKKTLYVSLMRNPLREFVSPSENHIGLRSFYPGLPKVEKAAKNGKGKKKKPRKKLRPMKSKDAAPVANAESGKAEQSKEIPTALQALMKDGKARKGEDIVKELETNLGHPVPAIAVYGTLKSKLYAKQENGEYRFAAAVQ
jgi:hypothetical protein